MIFVGTGQPFYLFKGVKMSKPTFRTSPEGFAVKSAVLGVLLAALLTQTQLLAFGSFRIMVAVFVIADVLTYLIMKAGIIKSPDSWGGHK